MALVMGHGSVERRLVRLAIVGGALVLGAAAFAHAEGVRQRQAAEDVRQGEYARLTEEIVRRMLPEVDALVVNPSVVRENTVDVCAVTCEDTAGRHVGTAIWDTRDDRLMMVSADQEPGRTVRACRLPARDAAACAIYWARVLGLVGQSDRVGDVEKPVRIEGGWSVRMHVGGQPVALVLDARTSAPACAIAW